MKSTIYSKILAGEAPAYKIWENDNFFAILDINPVNEGHTLIIPKKQVDYIFDLPDGLYSEIWVVVHHISKILKTVLRCKRIGIAVEGFGVPHTHVHLVPVNSGGELNPERAKKAEEKEMKNMYDLLSPHFKEG